MARYKLALSSISGYLSRRGISCLIICWKIKVSKDHVEKVASEECDSLLMTEKLLSTVESEDNQGVLDRLRKWRKQVLIRLES